MENHDPPQAFIWKKMNRRDNHGIDSGLFVSKRLTIVLNTVNFLWDFILTGNSRKYNFTSKHNSP